MTLPTIAELLALLCTYDPNSPLDVLGDRQGPQTNEILQSLFKALQPLFITPSSGLSKTCNRILRYKSITIDSDIRSHFDGWQRDNASFWNGALKCSPWLNATTHIGQVLKASLSSASDVRIARFQFRFFAASFYCLAQKLGHTRISGRSVTEVFELASRCEPSIPISAKEHCKSLLLTGFKLVKLCYGLRDAEPRSDLEDQESSELGPLFLIPLVEDEDGWITPGQLDGRSFNSAISHLQRLGITDEDRRNGATKLANSLVNYLLQRVIWPATVPAQPPVSSSNRNHEQDLYDEQAPKKRRRTTYTPHAEGSQHAFTDHAQEQRQLPATGPGRTPLPQSAQRWQSYATQNLQRGPAIYCEDEGSLHPSLTRSYPPSRPSDHQLYAIPIQLDPADQLLEGNNNSRQAIPPNEGFGKDPSQAAVSPHTVATHSQISLETRSGWISHPSLDTLAVAALSESHTRYPQIAQDTQYHVELDVLGIDFAPSGPFNQWLASQTG